MRFVVLGICLHLWASATLASDSDSGPDTLLQSVEAKYGAAGDVAESLSAAIERYRVGMETSDRDQKLALFAEAEQLFLQASNLTSDKEGLGSSELYVNLGNAALQAEHLGRAIWAYRMAIEIDPQHSQATNNLAFARQLVPKRFQREDVSRLSDTLFFWKAFWSASQIRLWASLCFLLGCLLLGTGIVIAKRALKAIAVVPFALWLLLALSTVSNLGAEAEQTAVVIAEEAMVRSADSANSAPRLSEPVSGGVEVQVRRIRDRWVEVELVGGQTGWLRAAELGFIKTADD